MKDKKYHKVRDHCHYTVKYRDAAHSICHSKYSVPKNIPITFHSGSYYNYHFTIKELTEEFKKQFTCLGENTEKYITFTAPRKREAARIGKSREKITKNISYYNLLIEQDLWQCHYQLSSIVFLQEFIKSSVNKDTMIKNVKLVELHTKYATVFLNTQTLKMI